jgi:SulP family sulfate permease
MTDLQLDSVRAVIGDEDDLHFSAAEQAILSDYGDHIVLYHFSGPVSFGAAKGIAKRLVLDENHKILILDLTDVPMVDTTGAFAIDDVIVNARELGASIILAGANPSVLDILERLGVMDGISQGNAATHSVETRHAALEMAAHLIKE